MSCVPIEPFKCRMYAEYLYNCEEGHEGLIDVRVLALSSHPGWTLTFEVEVLENGALFSNIPIDALVQRDLDTTSTQFDYNELDYEFCDSHAIQVFKLAIPKLLYVFIKSGLALREYVAEYMFTIDWPEGNTRQHMVKLPNGQFALVPNHKMLTKKGQLPDYKKLRHEWR